MSDSTLIRQPIVVVLGHVDHGKTMLLDSIRKTAIHKREMGAITQHIGASEVPREVLENIGRFMLEKMKFDLKIPGLLFIDTPGHEAFTTLRKRGGSIADIAVLVVDATQGFQPQTMESIQILKEFKTPFIVAMNKVDLVHGWKPQKTHSIMESLQSQSQQTLQYLDDKLYNVVASLGELGFNSDRFDRVGDFTREIAIVPVSAKTGEGLSELLVLLVGLSQRFLKERIMIHPDARGVAAVMEVKEDIGLGTTADCILYDGTIRKNDKIVFMTMEGPRVSKIRALLKPKPLDEMRDPRDKFLNVDFLSAASGVKIVCPDFEDGIVPGTTLAVVKGEDDPYIRELKEEMSSLLSYSEGSGVILKADTLGSLEAAIRLLNNSGIPVGKVGIGPVSKKDIRDAQVMAESNPYNGVVLAFNVKVPKDIQEFAKRVKVPVFAEGVVYLLIENFIKWRTEKENEEKKNAFKKLKPIGKIRVLPGYVFRVSKPAIVGVKVEIGKIRSDTQLVNEKGRVIGTLKGIQRDKDSISEAEVGDEVAVSIDGAVFGKDFVGNSVLYTYVPKAHANLYQEKYNKYLSEDEIALLSHILRITKQRVI